MLPTPGLCDSCCDSWPRWGSAHVQLYLILPTGAGAAQQASDDCGGMEEPSSARTVGSRAGEGPEMGTEAQAMLEPTKLLS